MAGPKKNELDFVPDIVAVTRQKGRIVARLLNISIAVFVVAALYWAHISEIDEVTRGSARVIPSGRVQTVSHLEGGIVDSVAIKEGDHVKKDTVLMQVNPIAAQSQYGESDARLLSVSTTVARLQAELAEEPFIVPEIVQTKAPEIGRSQQQTYQNRQQQRLAEQSVLASRLEQRQQETAELTARRDRISRDIKLVEEEIAITEPLVRDGIMSRINLIAVERQYGNLQGERREIQLAIERARQARQEVERQIAERDFKFKAEVAQQLADARAQLNVLNETTRRDRERVVRTAIRAPVNGIVKSLYVNTEGAVIQPGAPLVEIVPVDQALKFEAQINPRDIGFLKPATPAVVKLTAYDATIYGGVDAVVEEISADSIQDDQGNLYYRVVLTAEPADFTYQGAPLELIPGMTGTAELLGNRRTILQYLLNPVLNMTANALGER